jgi:hypothetical protein
VETFKLSPGHRLEEKLREVVVLYLNWPNDSVVPAMTRRTRSQALNDARRGLLEEFGDSPGTFIAVGRTGRDRRARQLVGALHPDAVLREPFGAAKKSSARYAGG